MVGAENFEISTYRLRAGGSASELYPHKYYMKIFELLTGTTGTQEQQPIGMTSNSAMAAGTSTPAQAPMQTASLWDTVKNFATTPHPIGGQANANPGGAAGGEANPNPQVNAAGQPIQTPGSVLGQRMFGNTGVGQVLDKINTSMQAPKQ